MYQSKFRRKFKYRSASWFHKKLQFLQHLVVAEPLALAAADVALLSAQVADAALLHQQLQAAVVASNLIS